MFRINYFKIALFKIKPRQHDFVFPSMTSPSCLRDFSNANITQVNRMSRFRRVLAIGGKQRIFGLDMVCIETILFHLDSF